MKSLKSLYLRNLMSDLYRRRVPVVCFAVLCTLFFLFLGYRNVNPEVFLSEEQRQELEEYNTKIEEYDTALAEVAEGLKLANTQVEQQQRYVDQSIYMRLDSQNIQVAAAQYAVETGGNVGNILSSIVYYINEGGLKAALSEEYGDLDVEYWREILGCGTSGNVLNITVMHYDVETAKKILEIAEQRIMAYVPEVSKAQGEFKLNRLDMSSYSKADAGVTSNQNNHLNTLKNYRSNVADFNTKLISTKTSKENYIEKNEPDFLTEAKATKKDLVKYGLVGMIFGAVLPCFFFAMGYILDNRLRSKDDLVESRLNVLGCYRSKAQDQKDLERSRIAVQLLAGQQNISSIYLDCLNDDELTLQVAEGYRKDLENEELSVVVGKHVCEDGEELKNMVSGRTAILIAQTGKTTYTQLEQHMELCRRFSVEILGCLVIE